MLDDNILFFVKIIDLTLNFCYNHIANVNIAMEEWLSGRKRRS